MKVNKTKEVGIQVAVLAAAASLPDAPADRDVLDDPEALSEDIERMDVDAGTHGRIPT